MVGPNDPSEILQQLLSGGGTSRIPASTPCVGEVGSGGQGGDVIGTKVAFGAVVELLPVAEGCRRQTGFIQAPATGKEHGMGTGPP